MHLRRHRIRVLTVNVFLKVLTLFAVSFPVQAISEPVSFSDVLQLPVKEVAQTLA